MLRHLLGVLGLCWLGGAMPLAPLGPTEVPPLEGRCTDVAGVLSKREVAQLQRLLRRYEQQSGHQFAVLLVPTLQNDTPEGFAVRVFEDWKLGKTGRDDGLLMLLVTDASQRDIRIEVGYGLEGAIPDAVAHRIIDEVILPALRRGKLAAGISAGLHALMKAAGGGEGAARDEPPEEEGRGSPWQLLLIPFLGIWPLLFGRRRRGGGRWGGGGFGGFGGGFGGGLGGGGGGGGDTFSGGGGRSGGGGASGKW